MFKRLLSVSALTAAILLCLSPMQARAATVSPTTSAKTHKFRNETKKPLSLSAEKKRTKNKKTAHPAKNTFAATLRTARSLLGVHYDWGGASPKTGFDCSGFIQYIFGVHGIHLPRTASAQAEVGKRVQLNQLRPGDLLFFTNTYANHLANKVTHVALYVGNGNVIESSSVHNEGVVVLHNLLQDPWYKSRYYGARDVMG
ncbi:C40 family peptidase [Alicyclobacillus fodiniaquatilis]|uniref:C40 family peptidase n=1 Tax=Alicyclobacillus fodiniaquatilis TaxID=1661150 RepID=A0ABW4JC23_9BACL